MKTLVYFISCFLLATRVLGQTENEQKKCPLSLEGSYIGELATNYFGGIKQGTNYLGLANIKLSFNTETAGWFKGGEFFVNGANAHGGMPSSNLVGDFQGISNIEAGDLCYLHELWYKQTLGKLAITLGLQDLNTGFISSENASMLINSSFGTHSTIADNIPVPIYPLTALGIQAQYTFSDKVTATLGIFDGFPDDFATNPHNLKWRFRKNDGLLSFFEIKLQHDFLNDWPGTLKLGGYSHNHFTPVDTEDEEIAIKNNGGLYLVYDQVILQHSNNRQLSLFMQASISPNKKNDNWYYWGLGLNYKGLFAKRTSDLLGIGLAYAGFNRSEGRTETAIEFSYKAEIFSNLYIQPDVQYIINPSGTENKLKNALVSLLRVGLTF